MVKTRLCVHVIKLFIGVYPIKIFIVVILVDEYITLKNELSYCNCRGNFERT